jgi:hypothetical protein
MASRGIVLVVELQAYSEIRISVLATTFVNA